MSETPEQNVPVDDAQAPVGGPDVTALQNELELLKANNRKLLSEKKNAVASVEDLHCLLYTSPSPRDYAASRMPSSA